MPKKFKVLKTTSYILPTRFQKTQALKNLDKDYATVKSDIGKDYKQMVKNVNSVKVSKTKKNKELARLKARRKKALAVTKQRYDGEKKRLSAIPTR